MKRAGEGKAVDEDLNVVIRLLQDKYPLTFLPEERDNATNPELRQSESEVLEAYYSRCQSLVLRSGGRDKPLDPSDTLTQAEGYILRDFIFKFVNGLYDKNLMQEAIGQSALAVDSLRQAMEVVTQAASILGAKATSAKLSAKNTRTALMEELIASHLGCSADEALSRAYQLPPGFMETFGGNSQPAPVSVNSLLTQLQPSIAQYRSSARNWENAASQQLHVVPVHQNHRVVPVYQNQLSLSSKFRQFTRTNRSPQVSQVSSKCLQFTRTNRSPQVARTSKLPQSIRISRLLQHIKSPIALVSLNHTGREPAQRGANPMTQLSPRSHMRDRPYVQPESQRINTSTGPLHCHEASFAIDVVFQVILLQSVLPLPSGLLRSWEVAWLKSMSIPPTRDDGTWVPGRVNARLAQIYLGRDIRDDYEPEDAVDTGVVARYLAVEPQSEPLDSECQQLVRYGELIRARPMKTCTEEVDARRASMQPRVEEVTDEEDEEFPLQPVLTSLRRAKKITY
ncbi:hypothetical protein E4U48_005434 [Claviceps purpurea]|nr:hypothetical protein E4U48_005434 [Claviceps purpurea]